MGGAHADLFHGGGGGADADELADGERLVQQDHQVGEQLLGRFLEGQADTDAAGAQQGPDGGELHPQALEQDQGADDPDHGLHQWLQALEHLFEITVAASGDALEEADADPVDQTDDHDRADDPQNDVVGPQHVVGQTEVGLDHQQRDDDAERNHGIAEGAQHEIVEVAGGASGETGQEPSQHQGGGQGDPDADNQLDQKVLNNHRCSVDAV